MTNRQKKVSITFQLLTVLLAVSVAACQNQQQTATKPLLATDLSIATTTGFHVKSISERPIKTTFLASQRLVRNTQKPRVETRNFQVSGDDLSRRFLVTVNNGPSGYERVSSATIRLNGKVILSPKEFNQQVSNISVQLSNIRSGANSLEIELDSKPNGAIDLSLDGFVLPATIPGAIHSIIADTPAIRQSAPYQPGKVGIKFLEGMKVRLETQPDGQKKLVDRNGTSLRLLDDLMKQLRVQDVYRAIGIEPTVLDDDEAKVEALMQTEAPNQNLFYYLKVDDQADVWKIVDQLRQLPFVEEAFPELIPQEAGFVPNDPAVQPSAGSYPTFPYTDFTKPSPSPTNLEQRQWLKDIHVLENTSDQGAWTLLDGLGKPGGDPNVKIAVVDYGPEHSGINLGASFPTHPDLGNIQLISNVKPSPRASGALYPYNGFGHGTGTTGIVGATGNNNSGVVGVSFGATTLAIHAFAFGYPSQCSGTGTAGCDAGADSIWLARKNGSKVIVMEVEGPGCFGGTIEHHYPVARAAIAAAVANNIVVMVPAGNNHDQSIKSILVNTQFAPGITYIMPDTGSIIVGGIQRDESRRSRGDCTYNLQIPGPTPTTSPTTLPDRAFNWGTSVETGPGDLYTNLLGHGTDVSGPADNSIYTTIFNPANPADDYGKFGGTSGATPAVGGVVALMLSVRPDLTPLEIRRTLRKTRNGIITDTDNATIAGMVNAFKAVNTYVNAPPAATKPGLFGKFFDSTVYFPTSLYLNDLSAPYLQVPRQPIAVKTVPNLDFSTTAALKLITKPFSMCGLSVCSGRSGLWLGVVVSKRTIAAPLTSSVRVARRLQRTDALPLAG